MFWKREKVVSVLADNGKNIKLAPLLWYTSFLPGSKGYYQQCQNFRSVNYHQEQLELARIYKCLARSNLII